MAVNDKIRTPDYNDIQSALATVIGAGSGNSGWGQSLKSSQVSVSNRVTVNEWANLRYDIINAYTHIYGSANSPVLPAEGNTVRYHATASPVYEYNTIIADIVSKKFTVGTGQYATTTATTSSTTWPNATYGSYWTSKIQCSVTVEFADPTQARYFFNSGGQIRFAASRTGGTSNAQNNSWSSILSSAGTQQFGGNNPGTGTTPADCTNWYRLTNVYTPWYSLSGSSPYGANQYRISARGPSANNSTGTASYADFLIEFIDNYVDPGQHPRNPKPDTIDAVDGTFTVSVSVKYATGILVPSGLGSFTVSTPTVTVRAITP